MTDPFDDSDVWRLLTNQLPDPQRQRVVADWLQSRLLPKVKGYLVKLGVDDVSAEDIAWHAVQKALGAYDPGRGRFTTFVVQIADRVRIDRYRAGLLPPHGLSRLEDLSHEIPEQVDEEPSFTKEEKEILRRANEVSSQLGYEDYVLIRWDLNGVPKESYLKEFHITDSAYRKRKERAYERLSKLL